MIIGYGIVAFRDPHGIRPLVLGIRETPNGVEHMVASESVALDAIGFELERDILPGEAVFIDKRGYLHSRQTSARRGYTPCIFEFVYFARPDSIIDNLSVYKARLRMGEKLADKILRVRPDHDIDVVIPIPDTSRTAAMQVAQRARRQVSRGLHQEPLHRPHVHHAGAVGAQGVGAAQAERDRARVLRQERAARRRLDRARHHVAADHRHGARGRRQEGLFRVGGAAGPLSERLRHRHAGRRRARRRRPHGRAGAAQDRRRLARLSGSRRSRRAQSATRRPTSTGSTRRASPANTSRATSAARISTGSR